MFCHSDVRGGGVSGENTVEISTGQNLLDAFRYNT